MTNHLQHLDRRCDFHRGISTIPVVNGFCPDCEAEYHDKRREVEYAAVLAAAAALLNAVSDASTEVKRDENIEAVMLALALFLADEFNFTIEY